MNLLHTALRYLLFFSLLLNIGCLNSSDNSGDSGNLKSSGDSIAIHNIKTKIEVKDSCASTFISDSTETQDDSEDEESDCVFNDDYFDLTTKWVQELGIQNYIWSDSLDEAIIPIESDTVFLSKGGCYHFGFDVKIKIYDTDLDLSDSTYWINRALKLASDFDMNEYVEFINN